MSLAFHHPTLSFVPETLYRVHPPPRTVYGLTNLPAARHVPIILFNLVGSGTDGRVWQGTSSDIASRITVKSFRKKEAALKEAEFYENASALPTLSSLIPKYFGLYAQQDQSWFILVMEDVGESLDKMGWDWSDMKKRIKHLV